MLTALPFNSASTFWESKGAGHFLIGVKTLKEDLKLVDPTYAGTAKLVAQVKRGIPQATPKLDGIVKMENPDNNILKKSKEKVSSGSIRRQQFRSCARTV